MIVYLLCVCVCVCVYYHLCCCCCCYIYICAYIYIYGSNVVITWAVYPCIHQSLLQDFTTTPPGYDEEREREREEKEREREILFLLSFMNNNNNEYKKQVYYTYNQHISYIEVVRSKLFKDTISIKDTF